MSLSDEPPRMTPNVLAFSVDAILGRGQCKKRPSDSPNDEPTKVKWLHQSHAFSIESASRYGVKAATNSNRIPRPPSGVNFSRRGISNLDYHHRHGDIQLELCGKDLWSEFHRLGNEMIITKAGRRMFPSLKVKVFGLDPDAHYIFWVDVVSLDDNRYRYVYPSSQWMVAGTGDPPMPFNQYIHPDCPSNGRHWMMQFISFDRLKLTNNKQPSIKGQISLHSMHKYQPRIHIQRIIDLQSDPELHLDEKKALTFVFPETAFITVTAYQNQQITRLKIASNPFAKGFRETVRSKDETDQYEASRLLTGRPHFNFPGVASVLLPHHLPPYPYLLSPSGLCNTSYIPYCLVEGCPSTSSHLISAPIPTPHVTTSPLSGGYRYADSSRGTKVDLIADANSNKESKYNPLDSNRTPPSVNGELYLETSPIRYGSLAIRVIDNSIHPAESSSSR